MLLPFRFASQPDMTLTILTILTFLTVFHAFGTPCQVPTDQPTVRAKDWWETIAFYQIYPRSFKDSNGDGVGDLNGITSKLGYLRDIGVGATWLSPCFQSPMVDFGYDISDFYAIHNEYGTLADFDALIVEARRLGIRIILDFVPNHSSDLNDWFVKSVNSEPGYEDFYVWHPGYVSATTNVRQPPSNWLSIFGGSAWTWNEVRQAYYLHQFKPQQPDLNYRNPRVVAEMKNVLRFWLNRGAAGFRVDAIPQLFEVEPDSSGRFPDELPSGESDDPNSWTYLNHTYTADLPETTDMVYQWRAVLDEVSAVSGGDPRVMLLETNSSMEIIRNFYGNGTMEGAQMPFNFKLFALWTDSTALDYKTIIDNWMDNMPAGRTANWVLGNHDRYRVANRLGVDRIDLVNILLQTLPGVSVTYYGDEIGMTNNEAIQSADERDMVRTPLQWDDTTSAGFSTNATTWLPVADDYMLVNVKAQMADARSHLSCLSDLTRLRRSRTLRDGDLVTHVIRGVLVLIRQFPGEPVYLIVSNVGRTFEIVDLRTAFPYLPERMSFELVCGETFQKKGETVASNRVPVKASEAFVLTAMPMSLGK